MKKRFLSLALVLSLVVSLGVPVRAEEMFLPAAEDDILFVTLPGEGTENGEMENKYSAFLEQFYAQYAQEHPEEYASFDPYAQFEESWGDYWDSPEEFIGHMVEMGYWDSAEDFAWEMWKDSLSFQADEAWRAQEVEDYRAAHPGELEGLTQEQLLAWLGYTETLTPVQQYLEDYEWVEESEVLTELLSGYVSDRRTAELRHERFPSYQAQYPERWAEFDADAYLQDEYAGMYTKETFMGCLHLFTEEEFVESLFVDYVETHSWEWNYEDNNWYWDGQDYERAITLWANGQPMDTDVTAADGVTYADPLALNAILGTQLPEGDPVSIRTAAEAAGWDIVWNSYRRQVILLDREKLLTGVVVPGIGWVEEDISGLDKLAKKLQEVNTLEPGQSYRTTGTVELTYTALNSLDGDEDYTAQLKVETLVRDKSCDGSLSMDLVDLLRLVPDGLLERAKAELPKTAKDLKSLLEGLKVNFIWNGETGMLYVNAPIVALVDPTPGVDGDTWYTFDLSEALEAEAKELTAAEVLYQDLLEESGTGWSGGYAYSDFLTQKGLFHILFGPHAITEKNGTLAWKLDEEMVSGAVSAFMGAVGKPLEGKDISLFKECELEMTLDDKGNTSFDMAFRPDMKGISEAMYNDYSYTLFAGGLLGVMDFRMAAQGRNSAKGGSSHMDLHWKNAFKLAVDLETARNKVKDEPRTVPPMEAKVIDLY